tara:strand:+ start:34 stop:768 length:735 start_codon:yes stop_codon:yes gene_type:complete
MFEICYWSFIKMKITKRQLRRVIREALLLREGYSVPSFPNSASMEDWLDELIDTNPDAEVDDDVIDPESGMLLIPAGESASEQVWFADRDDYDPYADSEGVAKMGADEPEGSFDYEAYRAEMEAEEQKEREESERIQDMVTQHAVEAGQDWAADTLYDAKNNPSMWQRQGHASAEDYVMSFGQDAAGDIADSLLKYGERDVANWWNDLPDKERSYDHRPTRQTMKDIVADYFYDGVSKEVQKVA